MKTVDRINQFIEVKGISLNAFDKSIGRPAGYIGKQIRSNASIGSDIVETILRKYEELSPQWLISGEGEMLRGSEFVNLSSDTDTPSYENDFFEMTLLKYLDKPRIKEKIINLVKNGEGQRKAN